MIDPACWTQVYIESDGIVIRNIKVHTGNLTPNRDGIDIVVNAGGPPDIEKLKMVMTKHGLVPLLPRQTAS